jgi:hypothetical protein
MKAGPGGCETLPGACQTRFGWENAPRRSIASIGIGEARDITTLRLQLLRAARRAGYCTASLGISMLFRRLFIQTLFFGMLAAGVGATTLPSVQIADLFREADVVARVQVTAGRVLGIGDDACGAKYEAIVEEGYKGIRKGDTIEFGNYYGYEVGNRYVLFLVAPGRTHEPVMSTNSEHMDAKQKFVARCGSQLRRNTVMHSGNGALPIQWTAEFDYKDAVRVRRRYVGLPLGTRAKPAKVGEIESDSDAVWVRVEDMSKLLNGLR